MKKILVTGTAGFIGYHLSERILKAADDNIELWGLDVINDYYDISVKHGRLERLGFPLDQIGYHQPVKSQKHADTTFVKLDLADKDNMLALFERERFDVVINLAAQAGVRYSLQNPYVYLDSNMAGFLNILEGCRRSGTQHLIYASSSSVYGLNTNMPFSVSNNVDHPLALYAASKKANELMAHSYSNLYDLPTTGLRFFTVYGPWGRPDMALFIFTKNILEGKPINVFNNGNMQRDFTYVDDITESIVRLIDKVPRPDPDFDTANPDPSRSNCPYRLFNIGNNAPVKLMDFVRAIEDAIGQKARINYMPLQDGDVPATYADVQSLIDTIDFKPETPVREGISRFVEWYRWFYKI